MRAEALRLADALEEILSGPHYKAVDLRDAARLLRQWPADKGIPRKGCQYLAPADSVCNKCGEVHHHHQMLAHFYAAPSQQPAPDLKHCACEFDGDTCVTQCKLHGAHVDAIHEWAERAKAAEAKLAQAAQGGMVMVPREPTQEMLAAAYAADKEYQQRMGVGDLVSVGPYDHYRAMIAAAPQAVPQPQPLTDEQFSDIVADASLAVDLAANPLKLLAFARAVLSAAPAVREPLTDEQVDEIWDGTFDSADPKRKLSFRQSITRAIERAHGIGITAKGDGNG